MKKLIGPLVLLLASLVLGVILGELNFRFFRWAVPPSAVGQGPLLSIHTYCILFGLGVGVLFFLWGLGASGITRLFQRR